MEPKHQDLIFSQLFIEGNNPLEGFKPYDLDSIELLRNIIKLKTQNYAQRKDLFKLNNITESESSSSGLTSNQEPFTIIGTPHPIGNMPASSCAIMDVLVQINALLLRNASGKEYNNEDIADRITQYLESILWTEEDLERFATANTESNNPALLIKYQQIAHNTNEAIEECLYNLAQDGDINNKIQFIQNKLSSTILSTGIPTEVISEDIQQIENEYKERIISKLADYYKVWVKVDADGHSGGKIEGILLGDVKGKNLWEIFVSQLDDADEKGYEPRISCDEEKKGVKGVTKQIEEIFYDLGINLEDLKDKIFDENWFNEEFLPRFSHFLEQEKYEELPAKSGGNPSTVNCKLDFILRTCLGAFKKNSKGMVLSDFPSDLEHDYIIPALMLIQKGTEKFIKDQAEKDISDDQERIKEKARTLKVGQPIMPLCESSKSILGAANAMERFWKKTLTDLKEQLDSFQTTEDKIEIIKNFRDLIFNNDELIFAIFTGPSDLTKDSGGISKIVIARTIRDCQNMVFGYIDQFNEIVESVKKEDQLENLSLPKRTFAEYGKGTSEFRGGNTAEPGVKAMTQQGINMMSFDTNTIKNITRISKAISNYTVDDESDIGFLKGEELDKFIAAAIQNSKKLVGPGDNGEDKGIIVSKFADLITKSGNIFSEVLQAKFVNNQGTRVPAKVDSITSQRAINAVTTKCFLGLVHSPGFPGTDYQEWQQIDFGKMLTTPLGSDLVISELFQFCLMDFERAHKLGFGREEIEASKDYAQNVLKQLFVGTKFTTEEEAMEILSQCRDGKYEKPIKDFLNFIIQEKSNEYDKRAIGTLSSFANQIDSITSIRDVISYKTEQVLRDPQNEEITANMAVFLDVAANFPVTMIAGSSKLETIESERNHRQTLTKLQNFSAERLSPKSIEGISVST